MPLSLGSLAGGNPIIGRGAVAMAITLLLVGHLRVYKVDILLVDMMVALVQPVLLVPLIFVVVKQDQVAFVKLFPLDVAIMPCFLG